MGAAFLDSMLRRVLLLLFCSIAVSANAQSSFLRNIEQKGEGWGVVTINQDATLSKLVNGDTIIQPVKEKAKNAPIAENRKKDHSAIPASESVKKQNEHVDTSDLRVADAVPRPAKIHRYKVSGYRVQIYAGSNSRSSRQEAMRKAAQFKSFFPETPAYTHFYPPRWVCRVGDFRSAQQAMAFMGQIRKTKAFSGLTVVKTAILVSSSHEVEE